MVYYDSIRSCSNKTSQIIAMTTSCSDQLDAVDVIRNSLCVHCGGTGTTRLLIHKIPYFRELIIASFTCELSPDEEWTQEEGIEDNGAVQEAQGCGYTNNEVTFGGSIQPLGQTYELLCTEQRDLDRQVIKSDSATVRIPHIDFEIPPITQKGEISTIEGFLSRAASNLSIYQEERLRQLPEVGIKVAQIICALTQMASGDLFPFTIIIDDIAGNSFIENPYAPSKDPTMATTTYVRTTEQDFVLGLQLETSTYNDQISSNEAETLAFGGFGLLEHSTDRLGRNEIIRIPQECPSCREEGEALTAVTDIPHFKEVIIMAFNCSACGFRNNDVKGGGAVPTFGKIK